MTCPIKEAEQGNPVLHPPSLALQGILNHSFHIYITASTPSVWPIPSLNLCSAMEYQANMMMMNKWQVPTFGNWDYYDFESARQAGLLPRRRFFAEEADLFKPPPPAFSYQKRRVTPKQEKLDVDPKDQKQVEGKAPKAVDEDLYKIPPELLHQKSKRKVVMGDFWKRCLGLSCIA